MSRSAISLFAFGVYLWLLGAFLIVVPNLLLGMFALPSTEEVWLRVAGVLVLLLGYYYTSASRKEMKDFFAWSVNARIATFIFFIVFVYMDLVGWQLILFGVIDLLGAAWTALALRAEKDGSPG
jgi:hypothetical protein